MKKGEYEWCARFWEPGCKKWKAFEFVKVDIFAGKVGDSISQLRGCSHAVRRSREIFAGKVGDSISQLQAGHHALCVLAFPMAGLQPGHSEIARDFCTLFLGMGCEFCDRPFYPGRGRELCDRAFLSDGW